MKKVVTLACFMLFLASLFAQELKVMDPPGDQSTFVNSRIKTPLKIFNSTGHEITFSVNLADQKLGSGQQSWLCEGDNCDTKPEDAQRMKITLGPGETSSDLYLWLETGSIKRFSSVKYEVVNLRNQEKTEVELNYHIEEASDDYMFNSPDIRVGTAYPNPVTEIAFIDYQLFNENKDVKILLHNVLGSKIGEFPLNRFENKLKISAQDLNPGVYFYTLYLDNEAIATKKLIVKK